MVKYHRNAPKTKRDKFNRRFDTREEAPINVKKRKKKNWVERRCEYCELNIPNISRTHNTEDCRHKKGADLDSSNEENKVGFKAYYDSCSTSHFAAKDPIVKRQEGFVTTGTGGKARIAGTAMFKVGNIKMTDVKCVPEMKSNLISANKLADLGYRAEIEKKLGEPDLKLLKDGNIVATGKFDNNGLLAMNDPIYALLSLEDHCKFGHIGTPGEPCISCLKGTKRKRNIPRRTKIEKEEEKAKLEVLEKVHVDLQGPFPINGSDGTRWNIKAVDAKSGYIKTETLNDKQSKSTKEFIERFKNRSERQTGKRLKIILTDGGNEFNGEFISYLESQGIIKRRGHE